LLKNAADWLQKKGIDYWQDWLSPPENFKDWIKQGFKEKQFFFVYEDNQLIGMFRLQWNDELFWGKQVDNSGYIHSLTVDRKHYGLGKGAMIIKEVENICRENHKNYLRLDCGVSVKRLCDYYKNQGFSSKGTVKVLGEELVLFEKA
jgi:GNAT superfamily N-acetyltransferase